MSQINDLQKVEKESGVLAQQLGRAPTFEEIAARVEDRDGEGLLDGSLL